MARDIEAKLRDPGFTPGRRDVAALVALCANGERDAAEEAERALAKNPTIAVDTALAELATASAEQARARLTRLLGRLARALCAAGDAAAAEPLRAPLLARLDDDDGGVRRQAIVALGRLPAHRDTLAALTALADRALSAPEQRALVEALGKSHDPRARTALDKLAASGDDSGSLDRALREADVKMRRGSARAEETSFVTDRAPARPLTAWLHAREGLENFLAEEAPAALQPEVIAAGRVAVRLAQPLAALAALRIALRFGFPLPDEPIGDDADAAVARVLTSDAAHEVLAAFTHGPVRYRIEWAEGGRKRAGNLRIAERVAAARPELVNDPRAPSWEAIVSEPRGRGIVSVELWPRGLPDDRFAYRKALVAAGSHPTLAAALARSARVRDDDVVWDPFVGSATELIECSQLAPHARLFGCDADADALRAARQNLAAATVHATLVRADARQFRPKLEPTLVITNPPMGRRVVDGRELAAMFDALIHHVAELLAPRGRMVWLSPRPRETMAMAQAAGLRFVRGPRVDMGGFTAELQRFEK
jgi:23S rRNA G2445 N2-methylase RlmL